MKKLIKFVTSKLTAKQNMTIANVIMLAGILVNLIDMMQNGFQLKWLPVTIAVVLVGLGAAWLYIFVRCPHCGDKLKGLKAKTKLPERCPECNGRLDRLPKKAEEE